MTSNSIPTKNEGNMMPFNEQVLDEGTRQKYFGKLSRTSSGYDPSVFIEALQDENDNLHLYVPARKRMAWFKTDYPEGIVMVDTPQYTGRRVTVTARIYKTREDFQANLPAAVNMATRVLVDNDDYQVDICVTRAQSRALRDMGYDMPRDAHIIDGWTPVKKVAGGKMPEEVMESGVMMENYMSDLTPETSAGTQRQNPASPSAAAKTARNNKNEKVTAVMAPPVQSEEVVSPEIKSDQKPAEVAAAIPPITHPAAGKALSDKEIMEQAKAMFATCESAETYSSRLLSGKTIGEQNEVRIKYYAQKALNGTCRDASLGLAAYLVAVERGYITRK